MTYEIRITEPAEAELGALPARAQVGLFKKMEALRTDPRTVGKPLRHQLKGFSRLRYSDWRIVYQVAEDEKVVTVIGAGHRKNVYE